MRLGDLPAERQTDPGAVLLGGVERHEEVLGRGQPGTLVLHAHDQVVVLHLPAETDTAPPR
jgi:hypothetical protein